MSDSEPPVDDFGLRLSWPESKDGDERRTPVPGGGVAAFRKLEAATLDSALVAALVPLIEELGELRAEVTALKRRVGVRVESVPAPAIDDATIERMVDAIADRVVERLGGRAPLRARPR